MKRVFFFLLAFALLALSAVGQQVPDTGYAPLIKNPAYARGMGLLYILTRGILTFTPKATVIFPLPGCLSVTGTKPEDIPGSLTPAS